MLQNSENILILNLANTLKGNKADTTAITTSLEMLCKGMAFDCGLIYEIDFSNHFHLKEHYASLPVAFQYHFPLEKISPQDQALLSEKEMHYMVKNSENTLLESYLLDIHGASALILTPVTDSSLHLYGFITLFHVSSSEPLCEKDVLMLSVPLSMLAHYVSSRMYQCRIRQSQITLENILDNTGIDIYVNDFYNHDILYVNKSMAEPYGGMELFSGRKCWAVLFPGQSGPCEFCPQTKLIDDQGAPTKVYSWDYQRPFDGSWFRVFSSAFYWTDGRLAHVVSSADITDNKQNEAIIENMANYDQLTKLPNRRMLLKECEHRIDKATTTEQGYVLFFDIDGFKAINDTLGHDAGDEFLINLGEFFTSIPLLKDSIYRNGGDEFVAIIGGESITKSNISSLSNFIHERFKKPWKLKNGDIFCNTSIGVACFPEDGVTAEVLLQKADMAMYQVKKSGGGGLCFGYQLKSGDPPANSI